MNPETNIKVRKRFNKSKNMKYLISYRSEYRGQIIYGYDTTSDPIEWIASVQELPETYILLNAQPITTEQLLKYDGTFKGM